MNVCTLATQAQILWINARNGYGWTEHYPQHSSFDIAKLWTDRHWIIWASKILWIISEQKYFASNPMLWHFSARTKPLCKYILSSAHKSVVLSCCVGQSIPVHCSFSRPRHVQHYVGWVVWTWNLLMQIYMGIAVGYLKFNITCW